MQASERSLRSNLEALRGAIARACDRAGRDPSEVRIVGATKSVPVETVAGAIRIGLTDVGENYVSELRAKQPSIPGARWHFIGALQTSGAHHVAAFADVVQTVAGGRATDRLARRAAEAGKRLEAMIEVDFTGRRSGVAPGDVRWVADHVAPLEGLRLVGLMTIPPPTELPDGARSTFVSLRELRDAIAADHPEVLELSMGMSLDYEVAVEEGATMVRVGTALFGPRAPSTKSGRT